MQGLSHTPTLGLTRTLLLFLYSNKSLLQGKFQKLIFSYNINCRLKRIKIKIFNIGFISQLS